MNKPKKHSSAILKSALNRISPLEKKKVENKMLFSIRLLELMKERGLNKTQFAEKVGKNNSEITKWLSGTHNFTMDVMTEIAAAFDVELYQLYGEVKTQTSTSVCTISVSMHLEPTRFSIPLEDGNKSSRIHPLSMKSQSKTSHLLPN